MMKKITFLIIFVFIIVTPFFIAGEGSGRPLEIDYPEIEGLPKIETTEIGLEEYTRYAFSLALVMLGFLLFGALLYNGVKWMTSAGNVGKLDEAKKGMKSALIGTMVLLSSYMVLNTINPGLLTLSIDPLEKIQIPPLPEGPYLCNFQVPGISTILSAYNIPTTREQAILDLYTFIEDAGSGKWCKRVSRSENITLIRNHNTYFIIPNTEGEVNYGIIFYDVSNGLARARSKDGATCEVITGNPENHYISFNRFIYELPMRTSFSVSPIRLNTDATNTQGIVFYEGYDYNESGDPDNSNYPQGEVMREFPKSLTGLSLRLTQNDFKNADFYCGIRNWIGPFPVYRPYCGVRSIRVSENAFVLFRDTTGFQERCHIVDQNRVNLDIFIKTEGVSGRGYNRYARFEEVEIIKGVILQ